MANLRWNRRYGPRLLPSSTAGWRQNSQLFRLREVVRAVLRDIRTDCAITALTLARSAFRPSPHIRYISVEQPSCHDPVGGISVWKGDLMGARGFRTFLSFLSLFLILFVLRLESAHGQAGTSLAQLNGTVHDA